MEATRSLHPQFAQDTVPVGDLVPSRAPLANDANFSWLILVPRLSALVEIIDPDSNDECQLMRDWHHSSRAQERDGLRQAQHRRARQPGCAIACACHCKPEKQRRRTDNGKLWETWRNLIWSRAIENLAVVVTTQNLFSHHEGGLAMVAAPEKVMFENEDSGIYVVDVSLDHLREMRAGFDAVGSSRQFGAKQGVLGPQWQRPELREAIYRSPQAVE
jgi:hypothetical protein